jgi:hypothetical protein
MLLQRDIHNSELALDSRVLRNRVDHTITSVGIARDLELAVARNAIAITTTSLGIEDLDTLTAGGCSNSNSEGAEVGTTSTLPAHAVVAHTQSIPSSLRSITIAITSTWSDLAHAVEWVALRLLRLTADIDVECIVTERS